MNKYKSVCIQTNTFAYAYSDVLIAMCSTLLLLQFSKKKDNTKTQIKILNGSLPLGKHTPKWTKNPPKISLRGKPNILFCLVCLVIIRVIPRNYWQNIKILFWVSLVIE